MMLLLPFVQFGSLVGLVAVPTFMVSVTVLVV
jgi:hypothetical protein